MLKVLLHDAEKIPMMKDLGIAVQPGTETFMAIRRTHVSNIIDTTNNSIVHGSNINYLNCLEFILH